MSKGKPLCHRLSDCKPCELGESAPCQFCRSDRRKAYEQVFLALASRKDYDWPDLVEETREFAEALLRDQEKFAKGE